MGDGVICGEIVAVAKNVAIVKFIQDGKSILGLCRIPAGDALPSGIWYQNVENKFLPIISRKIGDEIFIEPIIDGTPLLKRLQLGISGDISKPINYSWNEWAYGKHKTTWHGQLAHTTNIIAGILFILMLIIIVSLRYSRHVHIEKEGAGNPIRRLSLRALTGWFGIGRDTFKGISQQTNKENEK